MPLPSHAPPLGGSLLIRIFNADYVTIDQNWNTTGVRSSYWRLYVNSRDGAGLLLPNGSYPLAGGRVHLVPAWVQFSCHNQTAVEHFYVHFELIGVPMAVSRRWFNRPRTLPPDPRIDGLVENLRQAFTHGQGNETASELRIEALVRLALAALLEQSPGHYRIRQPSNNFNPKTIYPALRYIEDHLHQPIANQQLAEQCGLSPDHFIRRFRESVGQTPAQYVMERRVAAAAQLLLFGEDAIVDIARRTGFPNRAYFSRVFTRKLGSPPAAYRRAAQRS